MLEIDHLKKSFGDVTPLADVCCKVRKGDVVSVIGPSGTGKSTFLNLINHLQVYETTMRRSNFDAVSMVSHIERLSKGDTRHCLMLLTHC